MGTLETGPWPGPEDNWTVPGILRSAVARHGDRPCLQVVGGVTESYRQTSDQACLLARRLYALGVRPRHKVLVMLPNGHDAVHAWLALNLLNAVDVGLNTGYKGQSLEHAANLSQAAVMLATPELWPVVERSLPALTHLKTVVLLGQHDEPGRTSAPGVRVIHASSLTPAPDTCLDDTTAQPWDTASIIYTSGTSGPAKGVMMPHAQVALLARLSAQKMTLGADDVFFSFYPLYHMAGKFMCVLATLTTGGRIVLDTGFDPARWLQRLRGHGATVTAAHGPMLEMVHAQPPAPTDREHQLRLIRTAPFPKRIAADFETRFGVRGMEVWGMTEIGVVCWSDPAEPLRLGSCGRPDTAWYDFAVVDPLTDLPVAAGEVGEFVVRSRMPWTLSQGYLGMPDKTLEAWRNLWFHTGDCGYLDADGHAYFVDRAKERIRRRAENISAGDIEAAALGHPAVAEAAAVGVDSGFEGDDDILLCVVLQPGAQLEPLALLGFLTLELPHFMVPRYLRQTSSLPRTPTGKVQRARLRDTLPEPGTWDRKQAKVALRDLAP